MRRNLLTRSIAKPKLPFVQTLTVPKFAIDQPERYSAQWDGECWKLPDEQVLRDYLAGKRIETVELSIDDLKRMFRA